jgi:hypothetical protein
MVEGLSQVHWTHLRHALAYADDVPDLFARLGSDDAVAQREALEAFEQRLARGGEVYQAAAPSVPFLARFLEAPGVDSAVRAGILRLLAAIATGRAPSNDDVPSDERAAWVAGARAAVRQEVPIIIRMLDSSEREVRIAAAGLLATLDEARGTVEPALTARLRAEPDEVSRANLVAALHAFLPTERLGIYDELLAGDSSILVRRQAARALVGALGAEAPPAVEPPLLSAISEARALQKAYSELPWSGGGLVADSCWALSRLGAARAGNLLPPLMGAMNRAAPDDALAIAESALYISFGEDGYGGEKLASLQGLVVMAISSTEPLWVPPRQEELAALLRQHKLPDRRDGLRSLLS